MYNLATVIRFEITRILKKKSFWIIAFGFPIMIGMVFGIVYLSNKSTNDATAKLEKQSFSIEVTDESKLVNSKLLEAVKARVVHDKASGIANAKSGRVDCYIFYPSDLTKQPIEVYGKNVDVFTNGRYQGVAKSLLLNSVQTTVSPQVRTVIQGTTNTTTTIYRDGVAYDPIKEMILPGVFLVLFYLLIAFFGNQMLTSTTEEKENRVIEMLLTTIEARTLVIGKIISLIALAFFQAFIIVVPTFIAYLLFHDKLQLPSLDISALPVSWSRIGIGAAIFCISFILFTGLLVLIGSSVPTAREAGGFLGLVMMLIFGPLYAVSLFISAPTSWFVTFLTLFPFTAPIPLLLRNAVGNLQGWEVASALVILSVTAIIVMLLAVRVFRYGALEYARKLSLREVFSRR